MNRLCFSGEILFLSDTETKERLVFYLSIRSKIMADFIPVCLQGIICADLWPDADFTFIYALLLSFKLYGGQFASRVFP